MTDPLLEIKDLSITKTQEQELLIQNISFKLPAGKITGIAGESGSGKSITALSIMGLLPNGVKILNGDIIFRDNGHISNLAHLSSKEINTFRGKQISMIFQEPMTSLNPSMSCGKQIDELLKRHIQKNATDRKEHTLNLFQKVKLPDIKNIYNSYPHQLSGGQRQRIMIAMALAADPALLIADEPTTALDVRVQKDVIQLLKDLQKEFQLTTLFISHDLRLLKDICDEIIIMRKGRIVEKNNKNAFFKAPATNYSKGLIACIPPLDIRPKRLLTVEDFEKGNKKITDFTHLFDFSKSESILEVRNLLVEYTSKKSIFKSSGRSVKAVYDVSFSLKKGETLGLVGESGCGKTSLGRALINLIETQKGDIKYKGVSVQNLKAGKLREFRRSVQIVFQDPFGSLNPGMTVRQMLMEVIKVHCPEIKKEMRLKRAMELLELVGLNESDLKKYPHQFSGGQRQRINIARALAVEPEFIILDESVSALDVSVQARILNLLKDLKEKFNLSYLFISHDLGVVRYMSDRILVMKNGKIVESGSSDKIYNTPTQDYTRELIDASPGKSD